MSNSGSNSNFANYTPAKPKIPFTKVSQFTAYYWLVSTVSIIAIAVLEERFGDGSFERLSHSAGKLAIVATFALGGTLLQLVFGWLTASSYSDCVDGISSGRRQRNTWMTVSLIGGILLGSIIALIA